MKLFEKLSKKRALKKSKQKYFKKKNKPLFFFSTLKGMNPKVKRGLKMGMIIAIPVAFLTVGTSIGLYEHFSDKEKVKEEVILQEETITRRVYLLSKDNITVPLSVSLNKFNSVEEEIIEVFNLLKEDSKLNNDYFKGIIPKNTRILSLQIEDGLLTMNLSEDFLQYKVSENQLESSITHTMLQFDGIDKLSLEVGEKYKSDVLTLDLGINTSSYNLSEIVNKSLMTYFYQKKYGGVDYYIPKSIYVETKESDNLTFSNGLNYKLKGAEGLRKLPLYSYISKNQTFSETMTFEVENTALKEENLVKKELYNLLLLSMDIMGIEKEVSFTIEGEQIKVEGIIDEKEYQVSSIVYNEIKI